jgi:hypothetical protein
MSVRTLFLAYSLSLLAGCSQFQTGRSFLSEMEHDDTRFFRPEEDFPIVAGDSGRTWNTREERKRRTPASEEDLIQDKRSRFLNNELRGLENLQSDESQKLYEAHKHRFSSTSEKIYYLNLPMHERMDYLIVRGFEAPPKEEAYSFDRRPAAANQDILLGMSKDDVLKSWGKPTRVEIAGNPRNENERWLYGMNGASKYIYFESGEVQGWE